MPKQIQNQKPKYPQIILSLSSVMSDNVFEVMGKARRLMLKAGISVEERMAYVDEATTGDHDHFIEVTRKWFTLE